MNEERSEIQVPTPEGEVTIESHRDRHGRWVLEVTAKVGLDVVDEYPNGVRIHVG